LRTLDQSFSNTYPLYNKLSKTEQEDVLRQVQQAQSNPSAQDLDPDTINALIDSMPLGGVAGVTKRVVGKRTYRKFKFSNLKPMDRQFVGEETGVVWGTKVKYLNADERLQYQLQIRDGKLFDARGSLFDTSKAHSAFGGSENAIFVMDESGNIYASTVHSVGKFHHSSFLSGQPVASAGEIVVEHGVVKEITRRSGHYQPTTEQLNQFLERLRGGGVDLNNVNVGAGF
jgi:hypothetical protein